MSMPNVDIDFNAKNVLITGGAGFIGSNLAFVLQEQYPDVNIVVFDCFRSGEKLENGNLKSFGHYKNLVGFKGEIICGDINSDVDIAKLENCDFDYIFHQAAISDTRACNEELVIKTNVNSFYKLLEIARKQGAKMIYASSACTYGSLPSPQQVGHENPECPYGFSKLAMDQIAYSWMKKHADMHIVGLRYFNVYGPREYFKGKTSSMVLQLGHQILAGKSPRLFTDSDQILRDFVYIEDVLQAILKAASTVYSGVYNVGCGNPRSFQDIADILQKELGTNFGTDYFDNPYDGYQMHTQADISDTRNKLGYTPILSLEEGIRSYVPEIKRLYYEEVQKDKTRARPSAKIQISSFENINFISSTKTGKSEKILVIGDLMIDEYVSGNSERISPEAPVPVVNINDETSTLGGAGNVVKNLKAFGVEVDVLSVIGDCKSSFEIKGILEQLQVGISGLFECKGRMASRKSRVIASGQQLLRIDRETVNPIDKETSTFLLNHFERHVGDYSIILVSDYGKGVCETLLTQQIIRIANANSKRVLIDPKGTDFSKYSGAYLLTPNRKEASAATGIHITNDEELSRALRFLKHELQLQVSLITLSEGGIAVFDKEQRIYQSAAREVNDVTGAGDTVLASLGFALSNGSTLDDAICFANQAAGVVVGKVGSASASFREINQLQESQKKSICCVGKILRKNEITSVVAKLKMDKKKIVFTNGCFDILHAGHVKCLEIARSFGDVLVLGLNSDDSVSRLKGPDRPINNEDDRALILASLRTVDYVILFDEDTPYEVISNLKPHVLVKGGDYEVKQVVGSDLVDEVKCVTHTHTHGTSTTNIIEKIQKM